MAETLKQRVGRIIAGSFHAVLDRLEDQAPEAMMEQALREADTVIHDVRHELGLVSANRHLCQQQHAKLNAQHETLAANIDEAMNQSREELARAAVSRQLDIEAQLPVLEKSLADLSLQETELQGYVAALLAKKREMHEALSEFRRSRANVARLEPRNLSSATLRMDNVTQAFDRIYERHTGLAGTSRSPDIAQSQKLKELEELVRENKISERMAQLKAGTL